MSAAAVDVLPHYKPHSRAKRRQIRESHQVIDHAPISQEAKHLGHLLVDKFAMLEWRYVSASCDTLASWLEEKYAIRGCRYRFGRRGPARTGPKRPTLSRESIRRYVLELLRAGLLEQQGGGRAVGARYAGKKPRGLRWWLRPSGLLYDALRGAYKAWRDEFATSAEPSQQTLPLPAAVAADPPPAASSLLSWSTSLPSEEKQKVTAAPLSSPDETTTTDAPVPPRKNERHRSPHSGWETPSDDEHARRLERLRQLVVDPPAVDPAKRE